MNEFIIWDSKYKLFLDKNFKDTLQDNGIDYEEDDLYYGDEYYPLCTMDFIFKSNIDKYKSRLTKLVYLGLNDINNNKIYADCSIVEFEWKISGLKKVGYFYYSNEYLCYMIKWVSEYTSDVLFYDKYTMKNFKIIDTIQENKLGLIKE